MKVTINVLPDSQKEKVVQEKKFYFVLQMGFSLITALMVLLVVLFAIQLVLGIEYQAAKQSALGANQLSEDTNQSENFLKEVNEYAKKIDKIDSEITHWSRLLVRLSEICPAGIRISSIHTEDYHLKISGIAETREAFLDFQDKLENEGFENISSPISNIVSPKNFSFDIEIDLDEGYLISAK